MAQRKVFITYEDGQAHSYAIQIRAKQLGFALQKHMEVDVSSYSNCNPPRNSLILCVKPTRHTLLKKFIRRGNTVIVDILDTISLIDPEPSKVKEFFYAPSYPSILEEIDGAIFSNKLSQKQYQHIFKKPELCTTLYVAWDVRLKERQVHQLDEMKAACWYKTKNTLHYPVAEVSYFTPQGSDRTQLPLEYYNVHYGLRPNHRFWSYAPLQTVVTAAAVSAIPIALEYSADIELLTDDFPYQVPDHDKDNVESTLEFMEETFMEWEWNQALEIMRDIREQHSVVKSAENYYRYIKTLL